MSKLDDLTPQEAFAFWRLSLLTVDDVTALAMRWLEANLYTPQIAFISGQHNLTLSDLGKDFEVSLKTLTKTANLSKKVAVKFVVEYYLRKISRGIIDPFEGARGIINDIYIGNCEALFPKSNYAASELGIEKLYGLYYTLDDFSSVNRELKKEVGKEIRLEAKKVLIRYQELEVV